MRIVRWLLALVVAPNIWGAEDVAPTEPEKQDVLVVVGASGTPEFKQAFTEAADAWATSAAKASANLTTIGLTNGDDNVEDRERVRQWLENTTKASPRPLWFVYIGHGTYDGREAKLNLRQTDISAPELREWLAPFQRPLVLVLGNSASGPFLPQLSAANRIVITGTTSGNEINYARFGALFADAVADPGADIDQDGQTSVLEAYLATAQRVELFYQEAGRMASEHPLLDDNGDKRGTPPDWFNGVRLAQAPEGNASADGKAAHRITLVENEWERSLTADQRQLRDQVESELEALRARKSEMPADNYLRELEVVLRKLKPVYVPETEEPGEAAPEPESDPATESVAPDS